MLRLWFLIYQSWERIYIDLTCNCKCIFSFTSIQM
jgi:hypothetical protein